MPPRHHEVSRLEGFSDAVFGFALTLLVVTLETPKNVGELHVLVRGSAPFALMFAMVCYIWWEHNKFFRRFGLQDAWTAFLNAILLFVVLFYIYPLKYLTMALLGELFRLPDRPELSDPRYVMAIYSVGVVLIFGTFVLLYRHAWAQRRDLGLTDTDEINLRHGMRAHAISASLGVVSIALALVLPLQWIGVAGMLYALMGPLQAWNGYRNGAAIAALNARSIGPGARAE
jgi:uncharacterized membrane protein